MKIYSHFLMLLMIVAMTFTAQATDYYAWTDGTPELTSSWWTGNDGTGSHPPNFTTAGDRFIISNKEGGITMTMEANWTVTGTIIIEGNNNLHSAADITLQVGTLTINSSGALSWSSNLIVDGTATISGTATLGGIGKSYTFNDVMTNSSTMWTDNSTNSNVEIKGNLTNNTYSSSYFVASSTTTYTFSGNSKTISGSSATSIKNVAITGTITNTGTLSVGTALSGAGTLTNGSSGTISIGGTCSVGALANAGTVTISGSGAISTALANFTNTGTLNLNGSGTIAGMTNNAGGTINLASSGTITRLDNVTSTSTLTISAAPVPTITTLTIGSAGNTVKYSGAAQTAKVLTYSNLTLSGSGEKTFATTPTVNGILSMEGTASVVVTTGVVTYGSDATLQYNKSAAYTATAEEWLSPFAATGGIVISGTGAITPPAVREIAGGSVLTIKSGASLATYTPTYKPLSTLKYQGSAAQTTTSIELPSPMAGNVEIDNTAGVSLGASTSITGTLWFTSGNLLLGAHTLTLGKLGARGVVASSCVITNGTGVVKTFIEDGGSFTFPIGRTTTTYNPVTIKSNKPVTAEGTGAEYTAMIQAISPAASVPANGLNFMWTLTGAAASVTMSFSWINSDASSGLVADPECGVAYQYTTAWTDNGGATAPGTPNVTNDVTTSASTGNWTVGGNLEAYPGSGSGTSGDHYLVSSMAHLIWISQNSTVWGRYFTQTATIDASSSSTLNSNGSGGYYGWSPIGNGTKLFRGNYDGNGYTIDKLYINRSSTDSVGFFGYTYGGTIGGLGLTAVDVTGHYYVGGLAGFSKGTTFTNCSTAGTVVAGAMGGGLAGEIDNGTVSGCYSTASVRSTIYGTVGGLVGKFIGASVSNCYATGSVNAGTASYSGGFVASCDPTTTVDKCYSTGAVTGGTNTGGFTGYHSPDLTNCFWDTQTSGQLTSADGTSKTTAEMKTLATFTNTGTSAGLSEAWDFTTVWQMNGNYPDLRTNLNSALPVELQSFTSNITGNRVDLVWGTVTEVNNYGFDVERQSVNGWSNVGFVEGHGTTNTPQIYAFTDQPGAGTFQYRLKQIDRDGKFEYSQTVEANIATPVVFALEQNYPNPFNPTTNISFTVPVTGQARLTVFNILGAQVCELFNGIAKAGEKQTTVFDAAKYASGVYIYRLESAGMTAIKKMQLIR